MPDGEGVQAVSREEQGPLDGDRTLKLSPRPPLLPCPPCHSGTGRAPVWWLGILPAGSGSVRPLCRHWRARSPAGGQRTHVSPGARPVPNTLSSPAPAGARVWSACLHCWKLLPALLLASTHGWGVRGRFPPAQSRNTALGKELPPCSLHRGGPCCTGWGPFPGGPRLNAEGLGEAGCFAAGGKPDLPLRAAQGCVCASVCERLCPLPGAGGRTAPGTLGPGIYEDDGCWYFPHFYCFS